MRWLRLGVGGCIVDGLDTHVGQGGVEVVKGLGWNGNASRAFSHDGLGTETWREGGRYRRPSLGNSGIVR